MKIFLDVVNSHCTKNENISSGNVTKSAVSCDLVTFTEEILSGKHHFLFSVKQIQVLRQGDKLQFFIIFKNIYTSKRNFWVPNYIYHFIIPSLPDQCHLSTTVTLCNATGWLHWQVCDNFIAEHFSMVASDTRAGSRTPVISKFVSKS